MSLIRWSPFFFEPFDGMEKFLSDLPAVSHRDALVPAVDVYETKDTVVVEAPLPGVDPQKVDISIENGLLSIKGSMERKTEVDEKNYYRKEVRSGSIFRQVSLPTSVKEQEAEAAFENGVLKITFPKLSVEKNTIKVEIKKH